MIYLQVTFRDPESARRACADPNPMIDGRRANCNIASLGRPRPSPPRGTFFNSKSKFKIHSNFELKFEIFGFRNVGRNQVANVYQGSGMAQGGMSSYLPLPPPPPPVAPHPPVMYPPYGYSIIYVIAYFISSVHSKNITTTIYLLKNDNQELN